MEESNVTCVLWEADAEVHLGHFLLEEIFLVEKENNGGGGEILVIADAVKQVKTFMHSVLWHKE